MVNIHEYSRSHIGTSLNHWSLLGFQEWHMFRCAKMVFFHILHVWPRYEGVHAHQGTLVGDRTDRGPNLENWAVETLPWPWPYAPISRNPSVCFFFSTGFSMFCQVRSYPSFQFCVQNGGFQTCAGSRYIYIFFCDNSWRTLAGTVWCYYYRYYPLVI